MSDNFSLTPDRPGSPPNTPQAFPMQLQFRFNGVDLGGPDATVLDFVGDLVSAVRGTGDNAGKVTVTIGQIDA